jgi:predicted nucleotidyltransferase
MDFPVAQTDAERIAHRFAAARWPHLSDPYDQALKAAVRDILGWIPDVLGIIASGTIVRGTPDPTSDLDLYVLRRDLRRQRVQRWYNGVPAEIFINPVPKVHDYIQAEGREGRPITAHMVSTGFVVLKLGPEVDTLIEEAKDALAEPFEPSDERLTQVRYGAATRYEDATDVASTRPETAIMMMDLAVRDMIHYAFLKAQRRLPRDKDLLTALEDLAPALAAKVKRYYGSSPVEVRMEIAEQIADQTLETRGFFEWASTEEAVTTD